MDISEVVRRSGLPASTLHHYEAKGLITPTGRKGLRRQYDDDVVDRLALIRFGIGAGFTLDEISASLLQGGGTTIDRSALAAKADEVDARIRQLEAISDGLRHASRCPSPDHLDCDRFRELLGVIRPS